MAKRFLCMLLAFLTILSLCVPALADEVPAEDVDIIEDDGEDIPPAEATTGPEETPELAETPAPTETPEPTEVPVLVEVPEPAEDADADEAEKETATLSAQPFAVTAADAAGKTFANIVLFAYFSDQDGTAFFSSTANVDALIKLYNGTHGRSLSNYLNTVSYGKFKILNVFPQYDEAQGTISAVRLSQSSSEAMNGNIDSSVIRQVLAGVQADGTYFDLTGDGYVDNVTVILMGGGSSTASKSVTYYPHKGDYAGTEKLSGKGVSVYNILSTYSVLTDSCEGVVIHEFLHSLGYPDLYESTDKVYPVYTWDIMAMSNKWPSWPLAYLRMHFTNWVKLDTVTESKTLTLCAPGGSGSQAYILKSPLNDSELFVVEMRKRGVRYDENSLDGYISTDMPEGESGLIVYRVDTTVEGLTNKGDMGVYIFRPQTGYSTPQRAIMNAYLSPSAGRTSIGTADMSKGLADGALCFTDGSNSGIVIENVKTNSDGTMSCDVVIPSADDYDLWKDTGFPSTSDLYSTRMIAMASYGGQQYVVTSQNGSFSLYRYNGSAWSSLSSFSGASNIMAMDLVEHNGKLYLGYLDGNGNLTLKYADPSSGAWTNVTTHAGEHNSFSMQSIDGTLYIAADTGWGASAKLFKLSGSSLADQGAYFSDSCGQPKLAGIDGNIYVSVRSRSGNKIQVYRYSSANSFTDISSSSITGSNYGLIALNNQLKVVTVGSQTTVYTYDSGKWTAGKANGLSSSEAKLTALQGNLYLLTSSTTGDGYTYVYQYDPTGDSWAQEGEAVDSASQQMTLTASEDCLYISYTKNSDNSFHVRQKALANPLLSISVTPPTKTVYTQGEAVSTAGLTVTANYQRGSRVLSAGEYTVTGFDSQTVGSRTATVSFGGMTATFTYTVQTSATAPTPAPTPVPTPTPPVMPKITALTNTSTGVKITWDKVAGAAKYRVFYKNASGGWTKIADTTATSYIWTGAKNATTYTFTVRCINSAGTAYTSSYDSAGKTITFYPCANPAITAVSNVAEGVKITWGKVTGAAKYRVFYKTSGGWTKIADTAATSYTWTGAKSGTTYTFTVRCMNSAGSAYTSGYDGTGKSITYIAAPKLSDVSNTADGVKITWGKVTGAEKYRVFYKTGSGGWTEITDTTATSYTWTGAKNNTKYTFTVRCVNSAGSAYTSGFYGTGKSITYLAAPKISGIFNVAEGVKITWDKVTGAAKYRVFYKTSGGWTKIADTAATSYTWTGAKSGTTYTFTVRCMNSSGSAYTSGYDGTGKSVTYIAAPKLSGVSNTADGVKITWGKVTGAEKYRVFYKTGSGGWTEITDTTATSYTWTGAKSGTKYTFTVRCINSDGSAYTSGYDGTGKTITYK